ncbi:uncharacterized protein KY384_005843 [Bacidia gigantensis]|uniref:uncharacterized protein n=1 Tax=Bacidia gigantensis TaxID=2732470 RepID=UPI001D040674|nr:uncharacterized protein KY384_005843 [Bacidia gigantensis]KAG8529208.1 hypothetical protein KY384_005843 [Bacidia gigantensis]
MSSENQEVTPSESVCEGGHTADAPVSHGSLADIRRQAEAIQAHIKAHYDPLIQAVEDSIKNLKSLPLELQTLDFFWRSDQYQRKLRDLVEGKSNALYTAWEEYVSALPRLLKHPA